MRIVRKLLLGCGLILAIGGCTYVPFDTPKENAFAIPAAGTNAERVAAKLTGLDKDVVAMAPLYDGNDALGGSIANDRKGGKLH